MAEQKDPFNETQTIWRAESLPSEPAESQDAGNGDVPVRSSITMKKPSIDFNAVGTNVFNKKTSHSQSMDSGDGTNGESGGTGKKKGAGKMLWNMAASLKNMVTKKLTTSPMK